MSHSFLPDSYQITIRSYQIQWGTFLFQIPQCNLIQKGANLLPISFLSDSHQKKFWFFNAISILNQHTTRAAQQFFNFRAKTDTFITGGLWCTGDVTFLPIRLLSDSYHIPIRLLSASFQITVRFPTDSYQIPIRFLSYSHQIPIRLLSDS